MNSRFAALLLVIAFSSSALWAEDYEQQVVAKLMAEGTSAGEFKATLESARGAGVPKQTLQEAKMLWGLRNQDITYLTEILPELEDAALSFRAAHSPGGLRSVEQYRGMLAYIRALIAEEEKDETAFRRHITDAIWLFPQQGGSFGAAIERYQTREKMARVTLDFTLPLQTSKGDDTTFGKVVGPANALAVLFWSNSEPKSLKSIPDFIKLAPVLAPYGIRIAAMGLDDLETAEKARVEFGAPCAWLIEPPERPVTSLLEITAMPRVAVITSQGRILYQGMPGDPAMWKALKRVSPTLVVPRR